jgi:hypothetical protein
MQMLNPNGIAGVVRSDNCRCDVGNSDFLFRSRRYDEALALAKVEIARGQSHQHGSEQNLGLSLLLLGRCGEAQEYFEKRTEMRICRNLIGDNFTNAGMAYWFDSKSDQAIPLWEAGLKAGYQSQDGLEIPWVLVYASARRPDCYPRKRAFDVLKAKSRRLTEDNSVFGLNEFLLKRKTYAEAIDGVRKQFLSSRFVAQIVMEDRSLLDFFAGLHALFDGDLERFYKQMLASACMTGHQTVTAQLVIAECEIQQGPPKWKRRFKEWLAKNVTSATDDQDDAADRAGSDKDT